jgi:hypothetical protein
MTRFFDLPKLFIFALLVFTATYAAQPALVDTVIYKNEMGKRIYGTQHLQSEPPKIDGVLDDACWKEGAWSGNFTQQIPTEGAVPTAETELKIFYDDDNIYAAIRAHDDPSLIDRTGGRRDSFIGDIVGVCFDSYHDYRTGFEFDLTAAGGKIDLILMNEGVDASWNAVWDGKVAEEDSAWTAEFRIPLSQLRYSKEEVQVWGLHVWRWINRNLEEDQWALIPRDTPARMSSIGELHGIKNLPNNRRVELLPYLRAQVHSFEKESGNPFSTGSESNYAFGLDGKFGLSSDLTMDVTINPDFGQVEADPSILNLTVYETFFEEKRPFFLEGKNIFDFNFEFDQLFYSRRIGHRPSYSPDLEDNEYARSPDNTAILGAVKLSGKTNDGISIGILESVTAKEMGDIDTPGERYSQTVEPLSNYFVARLQKDYNNSNTLIGGMFTATNRKIEDAHLNFLNRSAYTGGLDFRHQWKEKTYYVDVKTIFSNITGDSEAILDMQTASARYFQRPDADHLSVDSTLTDIFGHGAFVEVGKGGNGNVRWDAGFNWRSPSLDLNDLGFLRRTDEFEIQGKIGYVQNQPGVVFRKYSFFAGLENDWDFDKTFLARRIRLIFRAELKNKWQFFANAYRENHLFDVKLLRGGPGVRIKGWIHNMYRLSTDPSKKVSIGGMVHSHFHDDKFSKTFSTSPFLTWKITNALQLTSNVSYMKTRTALQYICTEDFGAHQRYLLGEMDRSTLGMTIRFDYAITPEFTIQYYGNPYVSGGEFRDIKRIVNPRAQNYEDLYHIFNESEMSYNSANSEYRIDENGDGATDYTIDNPDFSFREFRSNLVARWEFRPSSTVYLVWTHGRSDYENTRGASLSDGLSTLFDGSADNVFLFKFNYWFSI